MLASLARVNRRKTVQLFSLARQYSDDDRAKGVVEAPKEHSCGIPPWKVEHAKPPPIPRPIPSFLVRPPCMPGSEPGGFQTCVEGFEGYYCIPCRQKYKYPSFSENIDFIPPFMLDPPCWWKMNASCQGLNEEAQKALESMTKRWDCNYD